MRIGITRRPGHPHAGPGTGPGVGGRGRVYGALDLGTNNCRLLIAVGTPDGFRVVDAFSRIVRLGEGLSASGRLSEAAMERTIRALRICARKIEEHGVTDGRYVATEACRRAGNCGRFLERVLAETGLTLETISNGEEASLGLQSCLPLLQDGRPHGLVFDIGGGSTEISWLSFAAAPAGPRVNGENGRSVAAELRDWFSMPQGVVTLAERFGGGEVTGDDYEAMIEEVCGLLAPFEARARLAEAARRRELQMLGTSGTVTTLAGVHKRLPRYQRSRVDGCYLDFEAARAICRRIAAMSYAERVAYPCIGRGRADLVVAGCAIFEAIGRTWPVPHIRVADRGLREGMIFAMMGRAPSLGPLRVQGLTPG